MERMSIVSHSSLFIFTWFCIRHYVEQNYQGAKRKLESLLTSDTAVRWMPSDAVRCHAMPCPIPFNIVGKRERCKVLLRCCGWNMQSALNILRDTCLSVSHRESPRNGPPIASGCGRRTNFGPHRPSDRPEQASQSQDPEREIDYM